MDVIMAYWNELLISCIDETGKLRLYTMDSPSSSTMTLVSDQSDKYDQESNKKLISIKDPKPSNYDYNSPNDAWHVKSGRKRLRYDQSSNMQWGTFEQTYYMSTFPVVYLGNVFINKAKTYYENNFKTQDEYEGIGGYDLLYGNYVPNDHGRPEYLDPVYQGWSVFINKIQGPSTSHEDSIIYLNIEDYSSRSDPTYNYLAQHIDIVTNYSGVYFGYPEFSNDDLGNHLVVRLKDLDSAPATMKDITIGDYFTVHPNYMDDQYDGKFAGDGANEVVQPHLYGAHYRMPHDTNVSDSRVKWTVVWEDEEYKDYTGPNYTGPHISENNYTLTGWLNPTIYKYNSVIPLASTEFAVSYTFVPPFSSDPILTFAGVEQSGYVSVPELVVSGEYQTPQYVGTWIQWKDTDDLWKDVESKPNRHYRFDDVSAKQFLGSPMRAKVGYEFMGGNVYRYSKEVCPSYDNYFDISDLDVQLSGVKYDKASSSNIPYYQPWIQSTGEQVQVNSMGATFFTVSDVHAEATFTLTGNTRNIQGKTVSHIPFPRYIWLVGVNFDTIFAQSATTKNTWMRISETFVNKDRVKKGYQLAYPNINSSKANDMIADCTGSPDVETAKGIVWKKYTASTYFDDHNDGSFDDNDYTMNVKLGGGKYALFVIVQDSTGWATAYCLTNPEKNFFDSPTKFKFE